ncbi:hypothetical protein [Polycladidibacter hongkongensis]|uniref:hypothetical protein n=1 Tax=Polycladidibacter hongkongensis TaxID=1647556 RepID=UPI0008348D87|nr:hypothetical protein [Pseudovibrio hongkongensis]
MAKTDNLGLDLIDGTTKNVAEEWKKFNSNSQKLDGAVAQVKSELTGKAAADHGHQIEEVQGLALELAKKAPANHGHKLDQLSDVEAQAAPIGAVLVKRPSGWQPLPGAAEEIAKVKDKADAATTATALQQVEADVQTALETKADKAEVAGLKTYVGIEEKIITKSGPFPLPQNAFGPLSIEVVGGGGTRISGEPYTGSGGYSKKILSPIPIGLILDCEVGRSSRPTGGTTSVTAVGVSMHATGGGERKNQGLGGGGDVNLGGGYGNFPPGEYIQTKRAAVWLVHGMGAWAGGGVEANGQNGAIRLRYLVNKPYNDAITL